MVTTTALGLVGGLRSLGLTEYEARVFVGLVAESGQLGYAGSTGYEVAKRSGVPRAKVYEVLRSLGAKGGAYTHVRGSHERHFPVEPSEFLRQYVDRAARSAAELGPALEQLRGSGGDGPRLRTVEGYASVIDTAVEVAGRARSRLFVAGLPIHVTRIEPALAAAEIRGVRPFVVTYGPAELSVGGVFEKHPFSDDEPLDAGVLWLVVVADNTEAVISLPAPEPTDSAVWTNIAAISDMAGEFVRQQVFNTEISRLLHERGINLNADLAPLQAMWFNDRLERE